MMACQENVLIYVTFWELEQKNEVMLPVKSFIIQTSGSFDLDRIAPCPGSPFWHEVKTSHPVSCTQIECNACQYVFGNGVASHV